MKIIFRIILVLVGLAVLAGLFYAEEDWRGKRAWEKCKAELEAKGQVLDWNAYIPPPVPDDQNFFKAPKMQEWFIKPLSGQVTNDFVIRLSNANSTATITNETAAINYLAWSDQFKPDFNLIREALKRPYARMDGGYSDPTTTPVPNFATVRAVSQTLAQRAKCYLLLHQPEKALAELALLDDSRHLLEAAPTGKPMTLVAAMLNVAAVGVYVEAISGGIQSHAWQEQQLVALQQQLSQINLSPFVVSALHEDCATECYAIENRIIKKIDPKRTNLMRGWLYQNMVTAAMLYQQVISSLEITNNLISPGKVFNTQHEVEGMVGHFRPWTFWGAILIPNFTRALQIHAYNQNQADEAQVACALERYRLANGGYPASLDALVPHFIEKLPHDIIGGQPLIYRPAAGGKFLLYSVGWNEKDDGGQDSLKTGTGVADYTLGDWVWKN